MCNVYAWQTHFQCYFARRQSLAQLKMGAICTANDKVTVTKLNRILSWADVRVREWRRTVCLFIFNARLLCIAMRFAIISCFLSCLRARPNQKSPCVSFVYMRNIHFFLWALFSCEFSQNHAMHIESECFAFAFSEENTMYAPDDCGVVERLKLCPAASL